NGWSMNGAIEIDFIFGTGGTLTFNQTSAQTVNNSIVGAGSIIQSGPGKLTLGGQNSFAGTTITNGAVLAITNNNALGQVAGPLIFDGGTLQAGAAGLNIMQQTGITANGGTLDNNGHDLTFSHPNGIGGPGGLTITNSVAGTGATILTAANPYLG